MSVSKAHLGDIEEDPDDGLDYVEGGCTPVGLGHEIQQDRECPRRHESLAATLRHKCHQLCQRDTHSYVLIISKFNFYNHNTHQQLLVEKLCRCTYVDACM